MVYTAGTVQGMYTEIHLPREAYRRHIQGYIYLGRHIGRHIAGYTHPREARYLSAQRLFLGPKGS